MKRALKRALLFGARATALGLGFVAVAFAFLFFTTDVERERFARPDDALTVTDRHGTPLRHHRPDGYDRRWVELDEVSPHLIDAVLAVEDDRFRRHHGVDARATARAVLSFALPGRRLSGGSTITQQVIKLVYGRPRGLWSKPTEIVRALELERRFDKDWILEQYLNRLPFGDQIVGVARASEFYFGQPVSELSIGQAALLAGIPQAPSALDPRRHRAASTRRRRVVLHRMLDTGVIDEATHRRALADPVVIARHPVRPWRAPRAAEAALAARRHGVIHAHGGRVRTTLDLPLTEEVDRILRGAVAEHAGRGVTNASAVVVSNRDGALLAYVGATLRGGDAVGGWLDLARARRQPGSTLKPFVYELLFERGATAATLLDDLRRPMVGADGTLFEPRDYDGRERGPVRAREALSASLNLAALDAARQVGADRVIARLRDLGMSHLQPAAHYGAAIVLGGADVSPLELAGAYATLARGGRRVEPSFAPADVDAEGVLVMDPAHAAVTVDILRDRAARREAFGDDLSFLYAEPFALKTGTSSGWRDAWSAVFTDDVTVVVWLGDPAGHPLRGLSGFAGAARPATRILAAAHRRLEALDLTQREVSPPLLSQARICAVTGELAGPRCTHTLEERFAPGTLPTRPCEQHEPDGTVRLSGRYASWLASTHPAGYALGSSSTHHEGAIRIAYPREGARLLVREGDEVPLRATVRGQTVPAEWEIDGAPITTERWNAGSGSHVLVAMVGSRRSIPVAVQVRGL